MYYSGTYHDRSRREFLRMVGATAGVMGIGALGACADGAEPGSQEGTQARVVTRLNWVKNVEYAGYYFADSEGYFSEENIVPLIVPGGPTAALSVVAVAGGQVDVGIQAALRQVILAIIEGADLLLVATIYQRSPSGLLSLPDNPILVPEDMIGKRIGAVSFDRPNLDAIFNVNNLPIDYEFVPVGFGPEPLIEGEVDALEVFVSDQPLYLDQQGIDYELVTYSDLGYVAYSNVLVVRRDFADTNREVLARYLRAVIRGWERNMQDPEAGAKLTVENYGADLGLDLNQQIAANKAQIPFMRSALTDQKGLMWISKEELAGPMYDGLVASGVTGLPDADKIVDDSILEMAFDGKVELLDG